MASLFTWILLYFVGVWSTVSAGFTSQPDSRTVRVGDTVAFTCSVQAAPMVFWLNGSTIISVNRGMTVPNPRVSIEGDDQRNEFILVISDIEVTDEGVYNCQQGGQDQPFTLTVIVPAWFSNVSENLEVELGEDVELSCTPEGKPHPTVTWSKPGPSDPDEEPHQGESLLLPEVGKGVSGVYECLAENGGKEPAKRVIQLEVRYDATVETPNDRIQTAPGKDIEIQCVFSANPKVTIAWSLDDQALDFDLHSNMIQEEGTELGQDGEVQQKSVLKIRSVQEQDLGLYRCTGENARNQVHAEITLTALPLNLEITSEEDSIYSDQYTLRWRVNSYAPILECMLKIKQFNESGGESPWTKATVPAPRHQDNPVEGSHTIEGLEAMATYSVKLRAKNQYGQTEWTEFSFNTADEGNPAPPPTTTPKLTTPMPNRHLEVKDTDLDGKDGSGNSAVSSLTCTHLLPMLVLSCLIAAMSSRL